MEVREEMTKKTKHCRRAGDKMFDQEGDQEIYFLDLTSFFFRFLFAMQASALFVTLHIVFLVIATVTDPTDPKVKESRQRSTWRPAAILERNNRPVISDGQCRLCRSPV